ncbi:NADPH-dependent FMN reductase [Photobacterium atrarenae]|uniref:NAD(P)H-dependent oxidoreductase n=1 Tax=Photobacterium atrarenae TaxID=865757 RepID=A0ABY5GPD5_9GAMM|nr:NADPH-dependent FMN reductase [Photobacterium atrarenae]UTV30549.1 NAD(P)H-dependent oxidoreductase [Photobacterium atrarenae]
MKKILAFSGSNHSQSIHNSLIHALAAQVTESEVTVLDLGDFELPMYGLDIEAQGIPANVMKLKAIMHDHDALIIASPEHNGAMPAFLKNVIDWLSRVAEPGQPFFGETKKPVLLASTSPGPNGGATNLKTMAELMPWWGGDVKATYSLGSYPEKFREGAFDAETQAALADLVAAFEQAISSVQEN